MTTRRCPKCGQAKTLELDFYFKPSRRDGKTPIYERICKRCRNKASAERNRLNPRAKRLRNESQVRQRAKRFEQEQEQIKARLRELVAQGWTITEMRIGQNDRITLVRVMRGNEKRRVLIGFRDARIVGEQTI